MSQQMVDKIGMRFGAALSAAVLVLAFAADIEIVVPIVAVALGAGAIFGPSNSPMSLLFRGLKGSILKGVPSDPEPSAPPRFAQTLGFIFLTAASIALWADAIGLGWTLALIVAVLQALLGTTGICIGCEMYLLIKKFGVRSA